MKETAIKKGLEKHPTQCGRLLAYVEEHGSISTMQAIMELGIINPAARVLELKRSGVRVVTTMNEGRNRFDEPCRYAVYTIKKDGVANG